MPIFRIYQLCGFAPFSIPFNMKSGPHKSGEQKWKVYNGLLLVYMMILVLFNIISYNMFLEEKPSEMLNYLTYIVVCGVRVLAVVTVIESTLKSNQQVIFLQQLSIVDEIVRKELHIEMNFRKMRRNAFISMVIFTTLNIIIFTLFLVEVFFDYENNWERVKWFFFTLPLFIPSVKYFQIILYIKTLTHYFRMINERLETMFASQNRLNVQSKSLFVRKNSDLLKKSSNDAVYTEIVSLRRIYYTLWKSTAQLNTTFQWSLLLLIGSSFIIIVVNYYRTLVWVITPEKKNTTETVTYFIWSMGHTFYFIRLSSVCYNVSQQVRTVKFFFIKYQIRLTKMYSNKTHFFKRCGKFQSCYTI